MVQLERQMQDAEEEQKLLTEMGSRQRRELVERIRKVQYACVRLPDPVDWASGLSPVSARVCH